MSVGIKTKSIYAEGTPGEGFRLLVMRRWPRGIRKTRIDEWDRDLSPSLGLLNDWIKKKIHFKEFKKRYVNEMRGSLQRQKIQLLAERAEKETIILLCHEEEDTYCHRKMLKELIDKCR